MPLFSNPLQPGRGGSPLGPTSWANFATPAQSVPAPSAIPTAAPKPMTINLAPMSVPQVQVVPAAMDFVPPPSFNMEMRAAVIPKTEFVPLQADVPKVTIVAEPKIGVSSGGPFKAPLNFGLPILNRISKSITAIISHPNGMEEKINIPKGLLNNGPVSGLAEKISMAVTPLAPATVPLPPVPVVIPNLDIPTPMPVFKAAGLSNNQKILIGAGAAAALYLLLRRRRRVSR